MRISNKVSMSLSILICLLPIVVGIYFLPSLPDQVAVHWNMNGQPDRWASSTMLVFGIPVFMALVQVVISIILWTRHETALSKMDHVVRWLIPVLSAIVYFTSLSVALGKSINMAFVGSTIAGLILIILGYFLPSTTLQANKKRLFRSFKTEESYHKAMRKISFTMIGVGLAIIISMFFDPIISMVTILSGICLILIISLVVTYLSVD